MLLTLELLGIISLLAVILYLFSRRFSVIRINGESMLPTFHHGQIRFIDRGYHKAYFRRMIKQDLSILNDKVFVIKTPTDVFAIKRLIYISETTEGVFYWFEGDNTDYSQDSRHYGFLRQTAIIGEVITFKQLLSRILKR